MYELGDETWLRQDGPVLRVGESSKDRLVKIITRSSSSMPWTCPPKAAFAPECWTGRSTPGMSGTWCLSTVSRG
jgi:hypothetical protein